MTSGRCRCPRIIFGSTNQHYPVAHRHSCQMAASTCVLPRNHYILSSKAQSSMDACPLQRRTTGTRRTALPLVSDLRRRPHCTQVILTPEALGQLPCGFLNCQYSTCFLRLAGRFRIPASTLHTLISIFCKQTYLNPPCKRRAHLTVAASSKHTPCAP